MVHDCRGNKREVKLATLRGYGYQKKPAAPLIQELLDNRQDILAVCKAPTIRGALEEEGIYGIGFHAGMTAKAMTVFTVTDFTVKTTLTEARVVIEDVRLDYKSPRPHS